MTAAKQQVLKRKAATNHNQDCINWVWLRIHYKIINLQRLQWTISPAMKSYIKELR